MPNEELLQRLGALRGELTLPGDKSISHRAFLLNTLGEGSAWIQGANTGADLISTRSVLSALGVSIRERDGGFAVSGRSGRLRPASAALDCGNSGSTMRLLCGLLAAQPFTTTLVGDESLSGRPMTRIARPLRALGARVEGPDNAAHPPLIITGGALRADAPIELPVASAQVKSCLLLAAAASGCELRLEEPGHSRDHTERLLLAMGAEIQFDPGRVHLRSSSGLKCVDLDIPGDPSAGALIGVAAMVIPGSRIRLQELLLNPTRSAWIDVMERMGVVVEIENEREMAQERVGDVILAEPAELVATTVEAREMPRLLDEVPALAVLAAFARGETRFCGVGELRVKESDRVSATIELLEAFHIEAVAEGDDLVVKGGQPAVPSRLQPASDHRMVMAGAALALGALSRDAQADRSCELIGSRLAEVSHPSFFETLRRLGSGR